MIDLDRSNVSNAYVSGMKEELSMHGNDFNVSSLLGVWYHCHWLTQGTENQYHLHLRIHRWHDTK